MDPGTNGPVKSEIVLIDISKIDTIQQLESFKGKLNGKIVIFDSPTVLSTTFKADGKRYTEEELSALAAPSVEMARPGRSFTPEQMAQIRKSRAMRTKITDFLKAENAALLLSLSRGAHGTLFTTNGASYAEDAPTVLPELEMSSEDYLRIIRLIKGVLKWNWKLI